MGHNTLRICMSDLMGPGLNDSNNCATASLPLVLILTVFLHYTSCVHIIYGYDMHAYIHLSNNALQKIR